MAYPTIAAPTTQQSLTGTTNHPINMPASVASGRMLVAIIAAAYAVTTPSGWTQQKSLSIGFVNLYVFTRITDGSEGGTTVNFVTASAGNLASHLYYATDANYTIANCFAISTGTTGTSTTPDPDSLTSGFGAVDTTWIAVMAGFVSDVTGFPASYGNTAETFYNNGTLATADRDVNGSSQNPGSFTQASADWAAVTIGIRANPTTESVVTSVTPDSFADAEAGVVIGGTGFLSPQSTGKVYLGDNSDYSVATKVEQTTISSWATTSITFTVDKGSLNFGTAYVFVLNSDGNVSNGWPVTLAEAPIALSAPAGVGACRVGLDVYAVGASTPSGIVTEVIEADTDEDLVKVYGWSATVPASARNSELLQKSRIVAVIRETEGEVFRGRIERREITLKGDEKLLTVSGPSIDIELTDAFTYEGLLLDGETPAAAYAAAAALAETTWTTDIDVAAQPVSRRYDDASVTEVRRDLDSIFHAYSRLTTTLRELNVKSTSRETGIRLRQAESVGPELLSNPAIGLIDGMEIKEEAFNVWNRIVPFGSSKTVLNGVRFGLGQSNRASPYTIQSKFNSAPSLVGYLNAGAQVNTGTEQNGGNVAVAGMNTALIVNVNVFSTDVTDRCLFVFANGVQMTAHTEVTVGSTRTQVFYLLNPPQGTASLRFGFSSTNSTIWRAGVWSLRDVYQAGSPIREVATATGSSTTPSVAVTSTVDDFVLDHMVRNSGAGSQSVGSGQTSVNNAANEASSYEIPAGASSTTMSWTLNTSDTWRIAAVSIKPSTSFYIEDSTSVTAHGRRTRALVFSDFLDAIGSSQDAANTLYEKAVDYLQKHKDGTTFYTCSIAYLAQGARAWNIGDSLRVEYQDAELGIDIDDMLVCVGRKAHYDSDGVRHWTLTLADVFRTPEDDAQVIASIASDVQSLRFNQV